MPNENVNHVIVNGVTKLDLRSDTVDAAHLMQGYTAHDRSGASIVGTAAAGGDYEIVVDPTSEVGTVETGTAVTATPNYTPSGDVRMVKQVVSVPSTVTLSYSYDAVSYVLNIQGVSAVQQEMSIPVSAKFEGSPVRLEIERVEQ